MNESDNKSELPREVEETRPADNPWPLTERQLYLHSNHSSDWVAWPDDDLLKSKNDSALQSLESSRASKNMHKDYKINEGAQVEIGAAAGAGAETKTRESRFGVMHSTVK